MRTNIKLAVLSIVSALCAEANAQSMAPQVLSNCGASASSADFRMDWTFGEFAIASIGNGQYHITQGFHQPHGGTVGIEDAEGSNVDSWIWPNPAGSELNLGFTDLTGRSTTARLLGMDGKMLHSFTISPGRTIAVIHIGDLAAGSYLLVIDNVDGTARTHRFIKTP